VSVEETIELPAPWALHHGDQLASARLSFRIEGPEGAPLVAALGGISAHRRVAGTQVPAAKGDAWWSELAGPGRALDTNRFRVLGIDYLGGAGGSTTPASGASFPALSAHDQAAALAVLVQRIAPGRLHAIVGASYGGMVALAFAARFPERVDRLLVLSAAHRAQALSTAWRSVQRQIVREALARGDGVAGLRLARALAMTTYRSADEFTTRFSGAPVRAADRFRFPVEDYLFARGERYVQQYRPESFLALSESIDLFSIDPAEVRTPATLVAVRGDQLVPVADMRALRDGLAGPARLVEIDSIYGHDAFLKEGSALQPIFELALTETHQ
jgi:homoserine O-acetyltransferase